MSVDYRCLFESLMERAFVERNVSGFGFSARHHFSTFLKHVQK